MDTALQQSVRQQNFECDCSQCYITSLHAITKRPFQHGFHNEQGLGQLRALSENDSRATSNNNR